MGSCLGVLSPTYTWSTVMVGLDGAGKTTILNYLSNENVGMDTQPTVGFEEKKIEHNGSTFDIRSPGGDKKVRDIWRHYLGGNTRCVIFVIDASDESKMHENSTNKQDSCKQDLHIFMGYDALRRDAPCLVFANKQDLPNAKTKEEIDEYLDLDTFRKTRPVQIFETSARNKGVGLKDGFEWLRKTLIESEKKKS